MSKTVRRGHPGRGFRGDCRGTSRQPARKRK
jgi:hypothetical protein